MPLVIVGAGGFGREVLDVVEAMEKSNGLELGLIGFLDDGEIRDDRLAARGAARLGPTADLAGFGADYVVAIGDGAARRRIDEEASRVGVRAATLVHPDSTIGGLVGIGPGTVVTAGVRITTNVSIGRHVHLNLNVTIGHDTTVGNYATIFPGVNVSGDVTLEEGVTLGTGSSIIQGVTVGAGTYVGAGAVVVRDLPPGVTAVGVPARPLSKSH